MLNSFGFESRELKILKEILHVVKEIRDLLEPRLVRIQIQSVGGSMGQFQLTVGQLETFQVVGFDQNGNPFTGPIPTPNWSIDQPSLDSIAPNATTPANEDVTSLAAGTANLTAGLTTAEGLSLTATAQLVNVVFTPVLTSIAIQPVGAQAAVAKKV
jgi:hypothetical protein